MTTFDQILERAETLSQDEREELIHVLQARVREERQAEIASDVEEASAEFAADRCAPASTAEIMQQILK